VSTPRKTWVHKKKIGLDDFDKYAMKNIFTVLGRQEQNNYIAQTS
jgi:hypothetical protein